MSAFEKVCMWIGAAFIALTLAASINAIDFHICIKAAGHCKIVDPKAPMETTAP